MIDLAAFVPRLAAELATDERSTYTRVEGSMLSADISGFTALSEKLAGKGKAGAEEITELINTCFTALIDAAYEYGGEIIKFGGDAILVLFRGDQHGRRCANAALAMQTALHTSPTAKRANLTMTVGASHGPFDVFLAGSGYRELLIIGPAASQVIHLEGQADKGETLVSDEIAATMPAGLLGRRHAGGVALVGAAPDPPNEPETRRHGDARMEAFVPPQVVQQLSAFTELGGEHRLVSVGFVMVGGVAASLDAVGPDGTARALGSLIDDVIAATHPYGVTALHTDIAPDGFKIVLCAGAPVNPGDVSDALLNAALAIAGIDTTFTLRQGAQTGRVFAGFLGAPYRRTYTLMGDPVNTAARMLGKAGDRDIVAVGSMVDDTRSVFETEQLEPFLVKGKTEPILACKVHGVTDAVRRDGSTSRLVGRERELEVLARAIGELGEIIDIVGPAGVGKSRLLDAAWDKAEGLVHLHGSCAPYGATSPYSVFRPLLRQSLGIDPRADPPTAGTQLQAVVEQRAPNMLPLLPLLAVPFGAEVDATPEVDAIDPEFRRARIHEAIVDLYDTTLAGRPVFMVIEDLHWVDDASGELVNHLVRAAASRRWAGVTTRRPEGAWGMDDQLPHVTTLELRPLTDDDIRRVAIEASERSLSDTTLDLIVERSQGNPLFALELTRAAGRGDAAQLPDSVEKVISSRIDDLPPGLRHLVRLASVFGNSFDLADMTPVLEQQVPGALIDDPGLAGIVERRSSATWAFRHALYRDAAYEGLPFRQRVRLHRIVAESIEERSAQAAGTASLLSLHYALAQVHDKAWHYSVRAGEDAAANLANIEAAAAYQRALVSAKRAGATPEQRRDVTEALGDIMFVLARFEDCRETYSKARKLNADPIREIGLCRKIGLISEREGNPQRGLRWFKRATAVTLVAPDTPDMRLARAQVTLAEIAIRHRMGAHEMCARLAEAARIDAVAAGDHASEALALERLHLALTYLHRPDDEQAGQRALALYRRLGDNSGMLRTLINLGVEAYFAADWTLATRYYLEATETGRAASSVVLAETAALNSAEILSDQGHWDRAIELFTAARRNWEAVGYPVGVGAATLFLAVARTRAGRLDEARRALDDADRLLSRIGVTELVEDLRTRELEWALLAGEPVIDRAERLLSQFGTGHHLCARLQRILGLAHALEGGEEAAERAFEASLAIEAKGSYEAALSSIAFATALPDHPDSEGRRHVAVDTFDRLDVAQPPPLPAALLAQPDAPRSSD